MKRKQKELKPKKRMPKKPLLTVDPEWLDPDTLGLVVRMIELGILPASTLRRTPKKRTESTTLSATIHATECGDITQL